MAAQSTATRREGSFLERPSHPLGYVAALAAVLTGLIHLLLATQVLGFEPTLAVLFALNGLGFLGGTALYLSRYWRPELYLVAALYALVTIVALFAFQGFGAEAFYRQGSLNPIAVVSKVAEAVLAICAGVLYATTST